MFSNNFSVRFFTVMVVLTISLLVLPLVLPPLPPPPLMLLFVPVLIMSLLFVLALTPSQVPDIVDPSIWFQFQQLLGCIWEQLCNILSHSATFLSFSLDPLLLEMYGNLALFPFFFFLLFLFVLFEIFSFLKVVSFFFFLLNWLIVIFVSFNLEEIIIIVMEKYFFTLINSHLIFRTQIYCWCMNVYILT